MKTHLTSSLPWANTHHHLTYTFFSHASTHKVRVHVPSIRGSSFLCKERAYLTYTICLRGKVNDYFKGLLSSAKNEEKLIGTKIIFGAWIYVKAPGFQPESDIIAPQGTQLQHADRQSKWNLLIFASFLGYWNVLRLEFFLLHVDLDQLVMAAHQIPLRISIGTEECCSALAMSPRKQEEARRCIRYRSEDWNRRQANPFLGLILFIPTKPKHPLSG